MRAPTLFTILAAPFLMGSTLPASASGPAQQPLARPASALPALSDLLTLQRGSIFYDYVREVSPVSERLADTSKPSNVFAPTNRAIIALPRKPHEDYGGRERVEGDGRVRTWEEAEAENVREWVERHIVPEHDLESGKEYPTLRDGRSVLMERDADGEGWKVGGIKVLDIREASNGKLWILDGVLP